MSLYQRTAAIAAFSLMLGLAAAACGKKQAALTPPPPEMPTTAVAPPAPPGPPGAPNAAPRPTSLSEDEMFARASIPDIQKEFSDVYFDLDNSVIKDEGRAALTSNANYMKRRPSVRINVEGHCDERGTAEYNLALGERRALAARNYLVSLGIPADRLRTVSYGKEFPFDPGHDEGAWSKNRRAHFVVTSK
jgi:peptidoglycan-associated lipoprotein